MIWAHFLFISTSFISNPLACLSCPLPEMIWATRFSFRSFAWTQGIERQSLRIALFKIHSDPINTDVMVTGKSSHWRFVPLPLSFEMSLFWDHWSLCSLTEPSKYVNTNNSSYLVSVDVKLQGGFNIHPGKVAPEISDQWHFFAWKICDKIYIYAPIGAKDQKQSSTLKLHDPELISV